VERIVLPEFVKKKKKREREREKKEKRREERANPDEGDR